MRTAHNPAENLLVPPKDVLDAMMGKKTGFSEYYQKEDRIVIRKIAIREELVIEGLTCRSGVSFVDCDFYARVLIRGGEFAEFDISGGRIIYPLIVSGGTFNQNFSLSEVDALNMKEKIFHSLILSGGQFNCNVHIYKGAWQSILIGSASLKGVVIDTGAGSLFNHELTPYIQRLSVAVRNVGVVEVRDWQIGNLMLSGTLEEGICSFQNVELNQLEIRYFINRGHVLFAKVAFSSRDSHTREKTVSTLAMADSDLGKTQFYDLDFTKLASVEIEHCALTEVESSNTTWFLPVQLQHASNETKRDIFRQLKHAMIRQGNRFDQLHFQAAEMDAYRKSLVFWRNPGDAFVLAVGKYTNNFGTNYILPAIWILALALLVFLCSARIEGISPKGSWGAALAVLNPAHPIDYLVPKEKITNAFLAVDFAGRVLISILIYQLITPFRKFARE